jgi:hypothetical protein
MEKIKEIAEDFKIILSMDKDEEDGEAIYCISKGTVKTIIDYIEEKEKEKERVHLSCGNCLHFNVQATNMPCVACKNSNNWQPKSDGRFRCWDCCHKKKDDSMDPCDTCNEYFSNWQPKTEK